MTEFLIRVNRRESEACAELYKRHYPSLFRLSLSIVRIPADAEDATSEIYARFLVGKKQFDSEEGIFAYLYVGVIRLSLKYKRHNPLNDKQHDYLFRALQQEQDCQPLLDQQLIRKEIWNIVYKAIENFPPMQYRVMKLTIVDKLTPKEIALLLGLRKITVYSHLRFAYAKLAILLAYLLDNNM